MKIDGKRAITCPLCLTRIKETSGKYTEEYKNTMVNVHFGKKHSNMGVIST